MLIVAVGVPHIGLGQTAIYIEPPAQFSTSNVFSSTAHNVENTGADYWEIYKGPRLRVACWDGDEPGIGWYLSDTFDPSFVPLSGQLPIQGAGVGQDIGGHVVGTVGEIRDPDVAVRASEDGWLIALTFLQRIDGQLVALHTIYRLRFKPMPVFAPVTDPAAPATRYPQLVGLYKACTSPNVDIGQAGTAVFVFESTNQIYARVRPLVTLADALPTYVPHPVHPVDIGAPGTCFADETQVLVSEPDVAVGEPTGAGTVAPKAHIVYVRRSNDTQFGGGFDRVIVSSEDLTQLTQPTTTATCADQVPVYTAWNDPDNLGFKPKVYSPRIAPIYDLQQPAFSVGGYMVAMRQVWTSFFTTNQRTTILSYSNTGSNTGLHEVTGRGPLTVDQCRNTQPAVATYDQNGCVDWTHRNTSLSTCFATGVTGEEVIGQPVELDGTIPLANPNAFPRLNDNEPADQNTPSASGGHSSATTKSDVNILHVWVDERDRTIRWREAASGAQAYRQGRGGEPAAAEVPTTAYVVPNPADAGSAVRLHLSANEELVSLVVVDVLSGYAAQPMPAERVRAVSLATEAGEVDVPLQALLPADARPGLYAVRVQTTRGSHTTRFSLR